MMRLDLDGLADASREALMSEWREVVGRPPPKHLSRPPMVQILSHAYQMDTVGGYTKRLDRRLSSPISQREWKSHIQHNCELDDLGAGFEIAEGYWIWHS